MMQPDDLPDDIPDLPDRPWEPDDPDEYYIGPDDD
jgi:hypothetical protein